MFETALTKICGCNENIKIIGVWGKDGLGLEEKRFGEVDVDLELLGAEIAEVINKLDTTKINPSSYHFKLKLRDYVLYIFKLTSDFFLVVLSEGGGIPGKLNFYVDIYRDELIRNL